MWWSGAKNGWISVYGGGGHPIRSRSARARTFGGQNLATSVLAPKSSRQSSPRHVLHKPNQFWAFFISNSERFDNTLIKFELLGRIEWKKSKLQISNAKPKLNANQEWYTHFAEVPGLSARFTVNQPDWWFTFDRSDLLVTTLVDHSSSGDLMPGWFKSGFKMNLKIVLSEHRTRNLF